MAAKSSSLAEYLKKYTCDENTKSKSLKKKKRKPKAISSVNAGGGVRIVDEDAQWQAEIKEESSQDDSPDERPQVMEDVEVKRMKRLEELKRQRPYYSIADDGSGWIAVSESDKAGLKEQCSPDSPNDRKLHSSPPEKHSQSGENHDNIDPKDSQHGNRGLHYEVDKFSSDSKMNETHPLPQKVTHDSPDINPSQNVGIEAPDSLPPRKHRKDASFVDPLPQGNIQYDSPDLSPPFKARTVSPDLSLPRKVRHDSPDLSPPRKALAKSEDLSPPRKRQREVNSSDLLRNKKSQHNSPILSPPRKAQFKSSDFSPPRKHQKNDDSSDRLVQKKIRHDSPDLSPPRKNHDVSPYRRDNIYRRQRKDSPNQQHYHARYLQIEDHDSSPPRRISHKSSIRKDDSLSKMEIAPPNRMSERHGDRDKAKEKMGDGSSAGLRTGKDLKEEIDRKKREENQRFSKMDPSLSGRGADTVYRDKQGKRLAGMEEFMQLQKGQPKPEEKPLEWGKGLAQKREAEAIQAQLEHEKATPFARSRDDPELDKMLKERIRWGDPMAHLVKKTHAEPVLENFDEDDKMKESGFIVPQDIPSHSWLKRGVDPPPNRYGIRPGRHWDGVDRSNGFEKGSFKRQNEKRATETEAYLWSVADM